MNFFSYFELIIMVKSACLNLSFCAFELPFINLSFLHLYQQI